MAARNSIGLLVPDLALTTALAALVILLAAGPSALLRDADAGWHIRTGERIAAMRSLPRADEFSFSKAVQPWIAWEWGADLVIGTVHRLSGLRGVVFVYACAIAATVWTWMRLNWAAGGNFLLAGLLAMPMLSTISLHWLARPHVFSWLFIVVTLLCCEKRSSVSPLVALAAGALWANVHGSFLLGPIMAMIYRRNMMAAAMLAGTFLNPNGWALHQHVVAYLTDSALLDRISEFQPFNFHGVGGAQAALALIIGIAGGAAALLLGRFDRALLALLFSLAAFRSARMLPVAALTLLPLANGSFARRINFKYLRNLRTIDIKCGGYAWLPVAAVLLLLVMRPAFSSEQFPVAASAQVEALPVEARIFSTDAFGGYMIYRFNGERKVFFDGRSDFYGADFLVSYGRMIQARPGWREQFAQWKFTHALIPPDSALAAALESDGWSELYRDSTAVLLKAKT